MKKQETGLSCDIEPADGRDELQTLLLQFCELLISAFTLNSESPFLKQPCVSKAPLSTLAALITSDSQQEVAQ